MARPAPRRMTLAEFLDWDDGTDTRYELIDGEVVAMAPPTPAHAAVVGNLAQAIGQRLRSPCFMLSGVGVARPDRADRCFVPDVTATCVPMRAGARYVSQPRVVIEVLSPSTRQHDRDLKLDGYREISSVQEILLVWSDQQRAQLWRRDDPRWIVEDFIGDAWFRLESIDVTLELSELYDNVVFEPSPEADGPDG